MGSLFFSPRRHYNLPQSKAFKSSKKLSKIFYFDNFWLKKYLTRCLTDI
jgi:hypothetical protein